MIHYLIKDLFSHETQLFINDDSNDDFDLIEKLHFIKNGNMF